MLAHEASIPRPAVGNVLPETRYTSLLTSVRRNFVERGVRCFFVYKIY